MLQRLERTAIAWCVAMTVLALVWRRGRLDVAIGVVGGGALVGASYWAIRSWVDRLAAHLGHVSARTGAAQDAAEAEPAGAGREKRVLARALALMVGRYALLGLLAYVMIARLRLHPIGLLLGASSVVVAAAIEAMRATRP
jgi:hypothetical protein